MTIRIAIFTETHASAPHVYQRVGEKYINAVRECFGAVPLLIPSNIEINIDELEQVADGVLVPGGYSNIERHHYGLPSAPDSELEDPQRDQFSLRLMPAIIEHGFPFLGICRGMQELNVALGGTLHPRLHEADGRNDHRENKHAPLEEQYGPAHPVHIQSGGLLSEIISKPTISVNSLHTQGIDKLASSLRIEAQAEDGTIEAVSPRSSAGFALALQWHPEWRVMDVPESRAIFSRFGEAARHFHQNRNT